MAEYTALVRGNSLSPSSSREHTRLVKFKNSYAHSERCHNEVNSYVKTDSYLSLVKKPPELKSSYLNTHHIMKKNTEKQAIVQNSVIMTKDDFSFNSLLDCFDIIVSRRILYVDQQTTIRIQPTDPTLPFKYSIYIGLNKIIDEDANYTTSVQLHIFDYLDFVDGNNTVTIKFTCQNLEANDYRLNIFKEVYKRNSITRNIFEYAETDYSINNLFNGKYVSTSTILTNLTTEVDTRNIYGLYNIPNNIGSIETTNLSSIPINKYKGIQSIEVDSSGCLYLISFDKRSTWYGYNKVINNFVKCDKSDILEYGLTKEQLEAIPIPKWDSIFSATSIDFYVYTMISDSFYTDSLYKDESTIYDNFTQSMSEIIPNNLFVSYLYAGTNAWLSGHANVYHVDGSVVNGFSGVYPIDLNNPIVRIDYFAGPAVTIKVRQKAPYFRSLTVNMIPNTAPEVYNANLSISSTHKDTAILTAKIKDVEEDNAYYSILINGKTFKPYTSHGSYEYDIEVEIPYTELNLGTNCIAIKTTDNAVETIAWTGYITQESGVPTVIGSIDYYELTALIDDIDEDPIKYRILVNGEPRTEWSQLLHPPLDIHFSINREDIHLGYQNTVTLEVEDDLGASTSVNFDFVGQNFGLIFMDENNNPYSDHLGNSINIFSVGLVTIGEEMTKPVYIRNNTNITFNNIKLWVEDNNAPDTSTLISKDYNLGYTDELSFSTIIEPNDVLKIYVKTKVNLNATVAGTFTIFARGDI